MSTKNLNTKVFGFTSKLLFAIAITITIYNAWFFIVGESAIGHVTYNEPNGRSFRPHVKFNTSEGQIIEFASEFSSRPVLWRAGDQVKVLYLKNNPNFARINSFSTNWFLVLILLFISICHRIGSKTQLNKTQNSL